jgi:FMN phosphatase YigB (HAD superfamily)
LVQVARVDPLNTLFIGDSLELDVLPAQLIGMKAIWLNRDHRSNPDGVASINSLSELSQFI